MTKAISAECLFGNRKYRPMATMSLRRFLNTSATKAKVLVEERFKVVESSKLSDGFATIDPVMAEQIRSYLAGGIWGSAAVKDVPMYATENA